MKSSPLQRQSPSVLFPYWHQMGLGGGGGGVGGSSWQPTWKAPGHISGSWAQILTRDPNTNEKQTHISTKPGVSGHVDHYNRVVQVFSAGDALVTIGGSGVTKPVQHVYMSKYWPLPCLTAVLVHPELSVALTLPDRTLRLTLLGNAGTL